MSSFNLLTNNKPRACQLIFLHTRLSNFSALLSNFMKGSERLLRVEEYYRVEPKKCHNNKQRKKNHFKEVMVSKALSAKYAAQIS